jgi:hypothetical protein
MNRLMINMPPMTSSLIAHASAYNRSCPPADTLAARGARPGNETNREQRAWI